MYHGERFNSISHLAGTVLAVAGAAVLIVMSALLRDPWKVASFSIYGTTLVALYLCSTLYHSVRDVRTKLVLRKFDHCAIYLLIAGTYTPFALVTLRGTVGWWLFGAIWTLAALGIIHELWLSREARLLSLVLYVLMGWLALIAIVPLWRALSPAGFGWLAAGGALYTGGIGFYVSSRKLRHGHGIWHLFVLAGSACHFIALLLYVA